MRWGLGHGLPLTAWIEWCHECRQLLLVSAAAAGWDGGAGRPHLLMQGVPARTLLTGLACGALPPSHQVLSVIKGLAAEGVTIVATIHSPTSYAFALFDRCVAGSPRASVRGGQAPVGDP